MDSVKQMQMDLFNSASQQVKEFWIENYSILKGWVETGKISAVSILDVLPDGITQTRYCLRGVFIGIDIALKDEHIKTLTSLGNLMESSGLMIQHLQKEHSAHQK